jgi:hypothetical protein
LICLIFHRRLADLVLGFYWLYRWKNNFVKNAPFFCILEVIPFVDSMLHNFQVQIISLKFYWCHFM